MTPSQTPLRDKLNINQMDEEAIVQGKSYQARDQLKEEMQVVKEGMGHGKLSIDSFSQVWKECYTQLLFLPAQNRYIRCITHQQEKTHPVTGKTSRAKLEKKLKILLGGYQSKGRIKQMTDLSDQLEHTYLEMKTFKNL
nr:hypothetical protein BaRGS_024055 [Batillaria attramentaria]